MFSQHLQTLMSLVYQTLSILNVDFEFGTFTEVNCVPLKKWIYLFSWFFPPNLLIKKGNIWKNDQNSGKTTYRRPQMNAVHFCTTIDAVNKKYLLSDQQFLLQWAVSLNCFKFPAQASTEFIWRAHVPNLFQIKTCKYQTSWKHTVYCVLFCFLK